LIYTFSCAGLRPRTRPGGETLNVIMRPTRPAAAIENAG
jgi:hypothetical protein